MLPDDRLAAWLAGRPHLGHAGAGTAGAEPVSGGLHPGTAPALAASRPPILDELETRKAELRARRDFLLPALRERGFVIASQPQGAFYLHADCRAHTGDSVQFAQALLEQVGVAVTPGLDFSQHQPQRYLRIAHTQPLPRLAEAIARIDGFLAGLIRCDGGAPARSCPAAPMAVMPASPARARWRPVPGRPSTNRSRNSWSSAR